MSNYENLYPPKIRNNSICQRVSRELAKIGYHGPIVLTGSRYFGNVTSDSDWDFFIDLFSLPDTDEFFDKLSIDWEPPTAEYLDPSICSVRKRVLYFDRISVNVDLQVISSFDAKCEAQHQIASDRKLLHKLEEKGLSRSIWTDVISRVKNVQEDRSSLLNKL